MESGLTATDFADVVYLGRHDKVAYAVASGNYIAGAMNENTFDKYKDEKNLRSILSFACVTKPWVAREGLDAAIYEALQAVLLALEDPELLKPLNRDGLLSSQAKLWQESQQIRAYGHAVRSAGYYALPAITAGRNLDEWCDWALEHADRMAPTVSNPPSVLDYMDRLYWHRRYP